MSSFRKPSAEKPTIVSCKQCKDAPKVKCEYRNGGQLWVTSKFEDERIAADLNDDSGLVEVKCTVHDKVLIELEPYLQDERNQHDIVAPSPQSFLRAIEIANDHSISVMARSFALVLLLTQARDYEDLTRKLSYEWIAEMLHLDVNALGPLISELEAAGHIGVDERGIKFHDLGDEMMPSQSSSTIH